MFKVNNKNTRTTLMTYSHILVDFEQVNVGWVREHIDLEQKSAKFLSQS